MSHDFARSHRPSPAAPKKKKRATAVPGWLSVMLGTFAGALVMYLVYVSGYVPSLPDRKATEQKAAAIAEMPSSKAKPTKEPSAPQKRTSPVFEFYTKLPASGAPTVDTAALPDAQAPAIPTQPAADMDPIQQLLAQQEAQKQQAASGSTVSAVAIAPDMSGNASGSEPAAAAPQTTVAKTPEENPTLTNANPEPKPEPVAKPGARYALQAGAFRKRTEADTLRAKLLLLGVKASIQPVTNAKGESMHRVIAGPFASASDMEDAKIILNGNHINTIPVK